MNSGTPSGGQPDLNSSPQNANRNNAGQNPHAPMAPRPNQYPPPQPVQRPVTPPPAPQPSWPQNQAPGQTQGQPPQYPQGGYPQSPPPLPAPYQTGGYPNQPPGQYPGQYPGQGYQPSGKKIAAGLCAILLAGLGIHKFILGYTGEGLIYLLGTIFTFIGGFFSCGTLWLIMCVLWLMSVIEGIIYLTKSDVQFDQEYVYGRKPWF